ncbi:MAG: hypothetical protein FWB80_08400 [Defluviitaleaceae bacterium]|nr:hypothetical protein [Defluviitaleaceae bacterium]
MKNKKGIAFSIFALCALVATAFIFLYLPAQAAQPGDAADPLVTRRFVEDRISQLSDEIAVLRAAIGLGATVQQPATSTTGLGANISTGDVDAIIAEVLYHFESIYGERLNRALQNVPGPGYEPREAEVVPFIVVNPQAGQIITFEQGAEFILRGGRGTAVTGVDGILDVTAGVDVTNGTEISHNHLMMIPRTDGRGVHFHSEAWIMIRGGYTFLN